MTILSGGNVGIGTTSPTVKLEVSGSISASGTIHGSDLTLEKPLEDSTFLTLMNSNTSGI